MSHGLEFNMNYEWAKSMDLNSLGSQGTYVLQDSNNPRLNYGLSDFDVRQHYAGTALYSLPFKKQPPGIGLSALDDRAVPDGQSGQHHHQQLHL